MVVYDGPLKKKRTIQSIMNDEYSTGFNENNTCSEEKITEKEENNRGRGLGVHRYKAKKVISVKNAEEGSDENSVNVNMSSTDNKNDDVVEEVSVCGRLIKIKINKKKREADSNVKLTINVSRDILKVLQLFKVNKSISYSEFVSEAIIKFLEENEFD